MAPRNPWRALASAALALIALAWGSASGQAASINYGNFGPVPPGITFLGVTESSITDPVPLFGPPTPFVTGLDFDPTTFASSAAAGGLDITDGQLNFTIKSGPAGSIDAVSLFEGGDYTLAGLGTAATQAIAGAILRLSVIEIDGAGVAPINLAPSSASVGFNLLANPGIVQPWSLGLTANIASQLAPGLHATGVKVVIDNQLLTLSEATSLAFLAKKDFQISVESHIVRQTVPEPSTALLAVLGGLGCTLLARSRLRSRSR